MKTVGIVFWKSKDGKLISLLFPFTDKHGERCKADVNADPETTQIEGAEKLFGANYGQGFSVEVETEPPDQYDTPKAIAKLRVTKVFNKVSLDNRKSR